MRNFSLVITALLLLTSCRLFQSSEIQRELQKTRTSTKTPALAGVRNLLLKRGIPHKIVYFRYDVAARPLVVPTGDRTFSLRETPLQWPSVRHVQRDRVGIIYRDDKHRGDSWWYVDEDVRRPIWLPTVVVEKQVSFAMRRHTEVFRVQEFDNEVAGMAKDGRVTSQEDAQSYWNGRFKRMHGTDFDSTSPVDQAKMRQLREN